MIWAESQIFSLYQEIFKLYSELEQNNTKNIKSQIMLDHRVQIPRESLDYQKKFMLTLRFPSSCLMCTNNVASNEDLDIFYDMERMEDPNVNRNNEEAKQNSRLDKVIEW